MKKSVKIRTKLYIVFIGVALIVTAFNTYVNARYAQVSKQYESIIEKYDEVRLDFAKINVNYLHIQAYVEGLLDNDKITDSVYQEALGKIQSETEEVDKHAKYINKMITSGDLKDEIDALEKKTASATTAFEDVMQKAKAGDVKAAREEYEGTAVDLATAIDEKLDELENQCSDTTYALIKDAHSDRMVVERNAIVYAVVMFLALVAIAFVTVRDITTPLRSAMDALKKLSKGEVNVKAQKKYQDEIGDMVDALNAMAAKQQRASDIAQKVSAGDLTMLVKPESDQDVLGIAIKMLVDENNGTLSEIRESASQVGAGSNQVAIASQSLAQGSTQQASALQQVTASIDDITEKTKVNAENAANANELVRKTKENAEEGNQEMAQMVGAMRDINESSENISKIIKTIDDIAFQTNILALNAAVEAARAGEHGKGFAVVAEEVRNLAAKSAEAASETAEMIEDSIQKVQNGSELAERTEKMLVEISTAVDNTVNLIEEIASASGDQASALSQIVQAVNQVSQVVQQNSATSEQCAAASEELSNQAKNLEHLVGRYQLRGIPADRTLSLGSRGADSFDAPKLGAASANVGNQAQSYTVPTGRTNIPDAADFASVTNEAQNEKIISLEDNTYSKY